MTDPAQRRPIERVSYWSLAAANLVVAVSVAFLAAAQWRQTRVDDALRKHQSQFNHDLVGAIHDLAAQSGMLTSADLCPVRFRLRDCSGDMPAMQFRVLLHSIDTNGDSGDTRVPVSSGRMSLFDFGLLSPGEYRLEMESPQGMTLAHDLTVLPGVPIDRVVRCPAMGTKSVAYTFDVEWIESIPRDEFVVVAQMEPAPFQCEEWVWQPPQEASRAFLLDQNSMRTLAPADYDAIADLLDLPVFQGADAELISTGLSPCRYWELGSLAFLQRAEASNSEPLQLVGIAQFGPDTADGAGDRMRRPRWRFPALTAQFESDGEQQWRFRLPGELCAKLHESSLWQDRVSMNQL